MSDERDDGSLSAGAKLALGAGVVLLLGFIAAREKSKESDDDPPARVGSTDVHAWVREKTALLIHEGYPPHQAYAIANRLAGTSIYD
jgi:hypothetical protein